MDRMEDVVSVLNQLLTAEVLDEVLLEQSVSQYTRLCELKVVYKVSLPDSLGIAIQPGIEVMDFELYNEEKQEHARLLKLEKVAQHEFEFAANMRDVEKECITYRRFKKHYGLDKSTFVIIEGFLIYAYFGTAVNDLSIREFLEKGEQLKNMKIR